MKKAIVTGATGFIGSTFVEYLTRRGVDVLALGRKELNAVVPERVQMLKSASYVRVPMEEISHLPDVLSVQGWNPGSDCVFFHLAWGGENGLSDLNIEAQMRNVAWSLSAIETADILGCSRFVHVGTMEEAFTERYLELDHHKDTQYNRHVIYSVAKIAAKYTLKMKSLQLGMDLIYVLHSHVMGPGDDKNSFLQVTMQKLINGEELVFSSGKQYFDVISLDDCSLGYYLICEKGVPGSEYWVGSGDPRPLRDYVERMYGLYPSGVEMQFGKLPYNDVILSKEDFSIANLVADTGYCPTVTYEQAVTALHRHLLADSSEN